MRVQEEIKSSYQYVVVGAGSAGCIAAARLADKGFSILLLEAGASAAEHPETLRADGFKDAFANEPALWHRMTESQVHCGGRKLFAGSGRVVGGSGAVNGMVYTRGDRKDFEHWPQGWRWDDIQPDFEAIEARLGVQARTPSSFAQAFIDAAVATGLRRKDGMNDGDLNAVVGCNAMNFRGAERRSSYVAYLHGRSWPNLDFICGAQVQKIVWHGQRAQAIQFSKDGEPISVDIGQELILSAGALETPRLLMLSGVGDRRQLQKLDLDCVIDAPGIGQHLQDHPNVCLFYRARKGVDFKYPQVYAFDALQPPENGKQQLAPNACFVCYAAPASIKHSMLRMLPVLALPGRLYHWVWLRKVIRALVHFAFALPTTRRFVRGVFGIVVVLGKPRSRGELRLRSADPSQAAEIDLGYFTDPQDRQLMQLAIEKARQIAAQEPLRSIGVTPLSAAAKPIKGKALWRWIHQATMTTFHYCGSVRMGEDDDSPVDPELRLKGAKNVRVADASVIPEIPVSAINAPSMLIGYRAADLILAARHADGPGALGEAA